MNRKRILVTGTLYVKWHGEYYPTTMTVEDMDFKIRVLQRKLDRANDKIAAMQPAYDQAAALRAVA